MTSLKKKKNHFEVSRYFIFGYFRDFKYLCQFQSCRVFFVIQRLQRYFGHIYGFRIFLVILEVSNGIFGQLEVSGIFFFVIQSFRSIIVIFIVLRYFDHFRGFKCILIILEVSRHFWLFKGFRGIQGVSRCTGKIPKVNNWPWALHEAQP